MSLEYFKSASFIESFFVILFGIFIILFGRSIDKKILKTKQTNSKWYKSTRMIVELVNTMIVIIVVLLVLSINGINVKKYVTSLGIAGIVLSFALQDLLKDIIMGLTIMFEGYFKVGDLVEYEGEPGKILSFNIKSTKIFLIGPETTMTICNRNISEIGICSDWVDVLVPIGYDVDLYYSRNLCRECAKKIERLRYVYSCDFLNTQELAESWVNYKLRIHCLPEKKPMVMRNANAVIQDVFYEHNQEFPLSIKVLYNVDPTINQSTVEKKEIKEKGVVVYDTTSAHRKKDYELGRGAAKSKNCPFDGSQDSLNKAITEAERYAISENLDNSMKLRLRLLSEELLSMVSGLPNISNGSFYIERNDTDYDICVDANAKINKKARETILEVSSTNTNEAYSGVSGMFLQAIDSMVMMGSDDRNGINRSAMNLMEESIGKDDDNYKWSYNIYKEKELNSRIDADPDAAFDLSKEEIAKSMLTKLSDDIRISVRTNHVSIRVLVKSEEDE